MLNQAVIVGRIKGDLEKKETKGGWITLAVPRSFKNENGEFDTDYIPVHMQESIANNVSEYCKDGDIVGVKARIQNEDGQIILMADKVTFLSSRKSEESEA